MLEQGPSPIGAAEAQRMLTHGSGETPTLIVPRSDLQRPILTASTNLDDILAVTPFDLDDSARNEAFVRKTIHFAQPPRQEENAKRPTPSVLIPVLSSQTIGLHDAMVQETIHFAPPEPQVIEEKPKINLITVRFNGDADFAEVSRQVDRGMQRAGQYEMLVDHILQWEEQLQRGENPTYYHQSHLGEPPTPVAIRVTPTLIDRLKHVAASMYAEELKKESITNEVAKGLKARQVLHEEAIVAKAEQIVFDHQKSQFTEFTVTTTTLEAHAQKPLIETPKAAPEPAPIPPDNEPPLQNLTDEGPEETTIFDADAVIQAAEEIIRGDRPNQATAKYFEEVFKRPF